MMMISSTCGLLLSTSIVCSMIGRPAILMSCLGMLRPTLVPTPPARTTATVRNDFTGKTVPADLGKVPTGSPAGPVPLVDNAGSQRPAQQDASEKHRLGPEAVEFRAAVTGRRD